MGAGVEWVVGQTLDKLFSNVQYLSNICQSFVHVQSLSNFLVKCPNFVHYLSGFFSKILNVSKLF